MLGVVGESGGVDAMCIWESGLCVDAWCHLCLCFISNGPSTGLHLSGPVVSGPWTIGVSFWWGFPRVFLFLLVFHVFSSFVVSFALTLRRPPALSVPHFGGGPL